MKTAHQLRIFFCLLLARSQTARPEYIWLAAGGIADIYHESVISGRLIHPSRPLLRGELPKPSDG